MYIHTLYPRYWLLKQKGVTACMYICQKGIFFNNSTNYLKMPLWVARGDIYVRIGIYSHPLKRPFSIRSFLSRFSRRFLLLDN